MPLSSDHAIQDVAFKLDDAVILASGGPRMEVIGFSLVGESGANGPMREE
jgi:hypothetical protein